MSAALTMAEIRSGTGAVTGETDIRAVFAAALLRERRARGWTGMELAERAGVSRATISVAERQRGGVSLETVALLARALGVPVAVLVGGEAGAGGG